MELHLENRLQSYTFFSEKQIKKVNNPTKMELSHIFFIFLQPYLMKKV